MNSRLKSHSKGFFSSISHWYFMNTPCLLVKAAKTAIQSLCLVVFNPKKSPFFTIFVAWNPLKSHVSGPNFSGPGCPVGFQFVQHVLDQIRGANQILTGFGGDDVTVVGLFGGAAFFPKKWDLTRQAYGVFGLKQEILKKHNWYNTMGIFWEPSGSWSFVDSSDFLIYLE